MVKQLFVYRGWRVRPFHRNIKVVTFLMMLLPFLLLMGYYGYLYYEIILQEPIKYGVMIVGYLCIISIMVELLNRYLYLKSTFFGRLDNLRILSTFLIENNFYISKKTGDKQQIKLPKVYVKRDKYGLDATFILQGNKFQDRFLRVSNDLEVMFDGDFIDKVFSKGFVSYTIAFGRIEGRINVKDVLVTDKGVRLMQNIYWNFDEQPHLLLSGGTGGGKTVFLMCLISALVRYGYVDICDPKKSDFVGLKDILVFQNRVFFEKEDMIKCLEDNVKFMDKRYEAMTNHPDFTPGKRYSHYGFKPKFIIFDEWAAFMASLDNDYKASGQVNEYLTQIVLKGRQAGVFIVLGLQRPDGEFIKTALRDNFMKRVSVGHLEDTGYTMMYGDANRNKEFKKIDKINGKKVYGRGYIANGGEIAREFFSPFIPFDEGFSFIDEFNKLPIIPFEGKEFEVFDTHLESVRTVSYELDQVDEEDFSSDDSRILLKDFSVEKGFDIKALRKIIDVLRGLGHEFEKKDEGLYLTVEQTIILAGVLSVYGEGQPSYAKAVEVYFEGENQ
ncbi:cell division protein FtsK [Streptococcus cuniculi]|uniref:Cell division protein FtsK n=1 Tax=Streptococcus cuniculi TaxID=1432788 RepID=A0A4Y9JDQ9_9STRE|nr:cell division protein FtsK [Streptococcus cuniculi]MBF0777868.1 cell division protein FtsK [Streptococcus cuniculi]TFU98166.1 cell division protein FtsK [Streptococcus cuniculi]